MELLFILTLRNCNIKTTASELFLKKDSVNSQVSIKNFCLNVEILFETVCMDSSKLHITNVEFYFSSNLINGFLCQNVKIENSQWILVLLTASFSVKEMYLLDCSPSISCHENLELGGLWTPGLSLNF